MKKLHLVILVLFVASCGSREEVAKKSFQKQLGRGSTHWESVDVEREKTGLKYSAVYAHESGRYEFSSSKGDYGTRGCLVHVWQEGTLLVTYVYTAGSLYGMRAWERGADPKILDPILRGPTEEFAEAVEAVHR